MKNQVQRGENLTIPALAAVSSGDIVQVGAILGIAAGNAASGADCDVVTVGVFDLPKVSTDAVDIGDILYFDAGTGLVTLDDDTGANAKIGVAVTAAANPSGSVNVRLSGF